MTKTKTQVTPSSAALRLGRLQEAIATARGERERLTADLETEKGRAVAKLSTQAYCEDPDGAGIHIDYAPARKLEGAIADTGETLRGLEALLPEAERGAAQEVFEAAAGELTAINGEAVQACEEFCATWGAMLTALERVLALREEHRAVVERATPSWRLLHADLAQVNERTGESFWPPAGLHLDAKHRFSIRWGDGRGALDHWLETRSYVAGDSMLQWGPLQPGTFLTPAYRNGGDPGGQGEKGEIAEDGGQGPSEA
jgi:hypothetical protein